MEIRGNLYFLTGKGGVGKSTLAAALAENFATQYSKSVHLVYFEKQSFHVQLNLRANEYHFSPEMLTATFALKEYLLLKLKSQWIADKVFEIPFFKALVDVLPGLSQALLLGYLVNLAHKNPGDIYVVDAPASGHFLAAITALETYLDIFKVGTIFEDLRMVNGYLKDPQKTQIIPVTLPTELALEEVSELSQALNLRNYPVPYLFINRCHHKTMQAWSHQLPDVIKQKISSEEKLLKTYPIPNLRKVLIPEISHCTNEFIIHSIIPHLGQDPL